VLLRAPAAPVEVPSAQGYQAAGSFHWAAAQALQGLLLPRLLPMLQALQSRKKGCLLLLLLQISRCCLAEGRTGCVHC
jgi:hypothetical protein